MMCSVTMHWILLLNILFLKNAGAMTTARVECPSPEGAANAYILTKGPYYVGDRVRYACFPGFSMTGTPSQLCDASQAFVGDAPICNEIDMAEENTNDQNVKVNVKKSKGFDLSDPDAVLTFILLMLFLLLLIGALAAVIMYMCCKIFNERKSQKDVVIAKPFVKKVVQARQARRGQLSEKEVLSPRHVKVAEEVEEVDEKAATLIRRASNISNQGIDKRRQSVQDFHEMVMKVMYNKSSRKAAKPVEGWVPHSKPVRKINTSTK